MSENTRYMHPEVLVDGEWVQDHLHDHTIRLIEVDVDTTAYEQGHILVQWASSGKRTCRSRWCEPRWGGSA
jgi:hypothetical protein